MPGISESERALFLVQSSLGALDTAVQPLDQEAQRQLASKLDRAALVRAQDAISNLLGLHDADAQKGRPPTHPPAAEGSPHVKFRNVSPASSVASSPGSTTGEVFSPGGTYTGGSSRRLLGSNSSKRRNSARFTVKEAAAEARALADRRHLSNASPTGSQAEKADARSLYLEKIFGQLADAVSMISHGDELARKWVPEENTSWKPKPLDLTAITISSHVQQLVEQCASNGHRRWLMKRKADGWRYGRMLNVEEKRDPKVCHYRQLKEEDKKINRDGAEFCVKIVTAMGYTFIPNNESRVVLSSSAAALLTSPTSRNRSLSTSPPSATLSASGVLKKISKGNAFVAQMSKVAPDASFADGGTRGTVAVSRGRVRQNSIDADVKLPPELDGVTKVLGFYNHETWASGKIKDGWIRGAKESIERKEHPDLVPFFKLDKQKQEDACQYGTDPLKLIIAAGYKLVQSDDDSALKMIDANEAELGLKEATRLRQKDQELASVLQGAYDAKRLGKMTESAEEVTRRMRRAAKAMLQTLRSDRCHKIPLLLCKATAQAIMAAAQDAHSRYLFAWDLTCVLSALYFVITAPLVLGFHHFATPWYRAGACSGPLGNLGVLDCVLETVMVLDFVQHLFVWQHRLKVHMDVASTGRLLTQRNFWIDLVGSIPFSIILLARHECNRYYMQLKWLHTVKVLVYDRLHSVNRELQARVRTPALMRLATLTSVLVISLHVIACGYWAMRQEAVAELEEAVAYKWVPSQAGEEAATFSGQPMSERRWRCPAVPFAKGGYRHKNDIELCGQGDSFTREYATAYYWALLAIIGSDMLPNTPMETTFTIIVTLLGIITMAAIVGTFSALVTHLDANRERKQSHMRQIDSFMKSNNIESFLRAQIHDFYDYTWRNDSAAQLDQLFEKLPPSLNVQLTMALKKNILTSNDFFVRTGAAARIALVRRLKSRVAIPNEIVIALGNPATSVFFVLGGRLQEFEEVAGIVDVMQTLETGAMFGLNAYFVPNRAHDVSVRACEFCTLESLLYDDLTELTGLYDDIMGQVNTYRGAFWESQLSSVGSRRKSWHSPSMSSVLRNLSENERSQRSNLGLLGSEFRGTIRQLRNAVDALNESEQQDKGEDEGRKSLGPDDVDPKGKLRKKRPSLAVFPSFNTSFKHTAAASEEKDVERDKNNDTKQKEVAEEEVMDLKVTSL